MICVGATLCGRPKNQNHGGYNPLRLAMLGTSPEWEANGTAGFLLCKKLMV